MKIYDKTNSIYNYGRYTVIKSKMLYRIRSILNPDSYCTVLEQSIFQNRPFKVLYYGIHTPYENIYISQEIITNSKYLPERKEYMINDFRSEIYNSELKFIFSKLDIQMLYRVMNHLIRKNKINSIWKR